MIRLLYTIVILCCCSFVIAAGPSQTPPLQLSDPQSEIAKLEDLIANAKASGQTPDPAWTVRIRELIPSIRGHASKTPADLQAFQIDGGFAPGAVVRPVELTPLEAQIRELEFQLSGGMSFQSVDPVTFANLKEQLNVLYAQRPENRERNPLDQGASICPGTVIDEIPYTDSGTTVGMGNDFNPISPCHPSDSDDVIYEFTPQATQTYNISLIGSLYDTYLYVNTAGACPGTVQVACNDDYFGVQSFVSVTLNAGQIYYIIVDGYDLGNEGAYVLNITDNCDVVCQPGDIQECAEAPGPGFQSVDCNGSCQNNDFGGTESWQDISPFQTVCGRGFTYTPGAGATFRDLDAYRFTISEPCSLALTINAEFASRIYVLDGSCPYNFVAGSFNWAYACSTATFITQCLQPGSYAMLVMPGAQGSLSVPRDYRARVDLIPCSGCQVDAFLQAPGSGAWNTCGAGNNNNLRPTEDYTFAVNIPYGSHWTFSTCNDDSLWDSYIYLSGTCDGNDPNMQDDDGCGGEGLSVISCVYLQTGMYYLTVEGYSDTRCGPFVLNVFECFGSCCYGDPGNPGCSFISQRDCDSLGGTFTYFEPCSTGACFTRPECLNPYSVYSQLPALPDEPWTAHLSDLDNGFIDYDDYSVSSSAIGSITFWGVHANCAPGPYDFRITFVDSVNNLTQVYNVTLTGTVLDPLYIGAYHLTEYVTQLTPPCTITNGFLNIAETGNGACRYYWAVTNLGNSNNSYSGPVGGPFVQTDVELAFCLGAGCSPVDSLTVLWNSPGVAELNWWQSNPGLVTYYFTLNPNDVYPAGFISGGQGYFSAGHNVLWFNGNLDFVNVVLVVDCSAAPPASEQAPNRILHFGDESK